MMTIKPNKYESMRSANVDNTVTVEAFTERKLLPTDDISKTVDAYQEYVKEKAESNAYRLSFTINPVCSNILFNPLTEIIKKDGEAYGRKLTFNCEDTGNTDVKYAVNYKNCSSERDRVDAIDDTAFSHPDIGDYEYHCGIDIFDNHTLRARDFAIVNKLELPIREKAPAGGVFNTISDFMRDSSGKTIENKIAVPMRAPSLPTANTRELHLYTHDSILSFQQAVNDKLVESDGWVGFINPVSLNIPNVTVDGKDIVVNKCINNKGAGEFIDMYPGRDLYSFIPRYNKYTKKFENNWDYCLTYPYRNLYDPRFVMSDSDANGIRCAVESNLEKTVFDNTDGNKEENGNVYLRTQLSNTLQKGDTISLTITHKNGDTIYSAETDYPLTVESVGYLNEDTKHYFSLKLNDLYSIFSRLASLEAVESGDVNSDDYEEDFLDEDGKIKPEYDIRMRKRVNGIDCKYYLRQFRKLPNLNLCASNPDDGLSEEEINNTPTVFGSTLSKMAYSENIFSDKIAQILYDENVVLTGIRDNMGRPLSEIYLTIVKKNKSNEASSCFGDVDSGFDLSSEETDYNVHKINYERAAALVEHSIAINPESSDQVFVGDIVEFSPYTITETVIEKIYYRFNTWQRELKNDISFTKIKSDDYDADGFSTETGIITKQPSYEGYYYQPHYRIPIKQYDTAVKQGTHKRLVFVPGTLRSDDGMLFSGTTSVNQYLNNGDKLYIYSKQREYRIDGMVTSVSGRNFNIITFTTSEFIDDIANYNIFKANQTMPDYSYDLMDATGRYLWREPLRDDELINGDELYDSVFTNGAHYRHANINFYLRRQDPTGEFGLNTVQTWDYFTGAAEGKIKQFDNVEYIEEGTGDIC